MRFEITILMSMKTSLSLNYLFLEGGARAAQKLMAFRGEFTAVAAYNDALAASCMATFENAGIKVPDEVSFIGFDNLFLSSCKPIFNHHHKPS